MSLPALWPDGDEPLALDMSSMGKGQVWINGQSLGRYWTAYATGNCNECSYAGTFRPPKCQLGKNEKFPLLPYQPLELSSRYHVPRSWLKPTQNLVVLFEELGGDPTRISLVKRSVSSVCADVTEYHPGQSISSIKFASFGTPMGTCGSFQQGTCHAPTSYTTLEKKCVGRQRCSVTISSSNFGQDPCPKVLKRLSVEAVCSPMGSTVTQHN